MSIGKKLERKAKSFSILILRGLLNNSAPPSDHSIQKILFLRYGGLGDMILSLPVFKASRLKYPSTQIDVLCDKKNSAPIEDCDLIDDIYHYEKDLLKIVRLIRKLRRNKYDYICNLIVYPTFTFGLLARLVAPNAIRCSGDQNEFEFFYNRIVALPPKKEIHMLKRLFLISYELTGSDISCVETPWIKFNITIEEEAKNIYKEIISDLKISKPHPRIIFINYSAGLKRREWNENKYIEFLKLLNEEYKDQIDGWAVFTFPNNPQKCSRIVEQIGTNSVIRIPLIKNFRIIMELLKYCYMLISPDTAFIHAASAMNTPVLDFIIGENAVTWTPVSVKNHMVVSKNDFDLKDLSVKEAIAGFENLIEQLKIN